MTQEPVQRKLQFVLKKYGIRPTTNVLLNFFSMGNEIFFINAGRERYVLKNCMKKRKVDELLIEIEVMRHLNANGCHSLEVVPDLEGNKIVEYNGDFFMMTRFLKGRNITWHSRLKKYMFTESFRGMALYHRAIADLAPEWDTDLIKTCDHERIMHWSTNLKDELNRDKSGRESIQRMSRIIETVIIYAKKMQTVLSNEVIEKCEKLLIHGDFHFYNCTFRRNKFYGCYDFDFIRRDIKIFDISWLAMVTRYNLYRMRYGSKIYDNDFVPDEAEELAILTKTCQWIKQHYLPLYNLNDTELNLLPDLEAARLLYSVRFFKLSNSEEECLKHVDWFEYQCQRIEKHTRIYRNAVKSVFDL